MDFKSVFDKAKKKTLGSMAGVVVDEPSVDETITMENLKKILSDHGVVISTEKQDWFADGHPPEIKKKHHKEKGDK